MKALVRMAVLVCILAASTALAAQQADLDRWLEEYITINNNPAGFAERSRQYLEASEKGNIVATVMAERMVGIANPSEVGKWVKANQDNKIVAILQEQAADDARAQLLLSAIYFSGLCGVAADATQAVAWLRKAAEQGLAPAQYSLAMHYEEGRNGLPKDTSAAMLWHGKAAEQGDAFSKKRLEILKAEMARASADSQPKAASGGATWFKLFNRTGFPIMRLFIVPAESSGWGDNLQKRNTVIQDGNSGGTVINLPRPLSPGNRYNIRVVDTYGGGRSYIRMNVPIKNGAEVTFTRQNLQR